MRVVVVGANGFIGKSLTKKLQKENVPYLALTRNEVDLLENDASTKLEKLIEPGDSLIFLSCITPDKGRGTDATTKNVLMCDQLCQAVSKKNLSHVIYLSSDTVYPLNRGVISEESAPYPENLFGAMHICREYMVKTLNAPIAILRSTLVYGAEDTHNSYGPNRIRRMAQKDNKITLFGGGEELRDHIFVEDVARLIFLTWQQKKVGTLNLATGNSISYFDLSKKIAALFERPVEVIKTARNTPITHRHFDTSLVYKWFPGFTFTKLDEGLREAQKELIMQG